MCRARERVVLQSKYYIQYSGCSGHVWKLCYVRRMLQLKPVGSAVRSTKNAKFTIFTAPAERRRPRVERGWVWTGAVAMGGPL
jgi:hypothetical protein